MTLSFEGRVAIVTGAGGSLGLGRAYSRLLAARGARIVVNDLGIGPDGRGTVETSPQKVAQEIVAAGGEAIANNDSVADQTGARAIVQAALDEWGRLDIVVNNAGVVIPSSIAEISAIDVQKMIDVHVLGTIFMCQAAWEPMRNASYGRIVNITSRAVLGSFGNVAVYGAAKAGILGLTRCLATDGDELGIKVNALAPHAGTAATAEVIEPGDPFLRTSNDSEPPELVAPVAALLAHETCPFTGKCLKALGGSVSEIYFAETEGYVNQHLTLENLSDNLDRVLDRSTHQAVPDPSASGAPTIAHRPYVPS